MSAEISRSEQKRRIKRLEEMVGELCQLPPGLVRQLPCSERLRELLRQASTMKHGARKRQVKFITKLLKEEPVDSLYGFLTEKKGAALEDKKRFKEIEFLRDALLNEAIELQRMLEEQDEEMPEDWPSRTAEEIQDKFPLIDRKQLTRLARMFAVTRQRKYGREIFRLLSAEQEKQKYTSPKTGIDGNGDT